MTQLFSPNDVRRDPFDIVLEQETNLHNVSKWLIRSLGLEGYIPPPEAPISHALNIIRDQDLFKRELEPIFGMMEEGDSLWLCRSRTIGPLLGHRGIALVRDNQPVVYIRMIQY